MKDLMIQCLIEKGNISKLAILIRFDGRDVKTLKEKTFWRKKNQIQESENTGAGGSRWEKGRLDCGMPGAASEPLAHPGPNLRFLCNGGKPIGCLLT